MERLLGLAPTNQAKANQHTVTQKQFFRRWRFSSSLSLSFFFLCLYYYSALLCHIVEGKHTFQNQASAAASVQNRCSKPKPKPSNCCLLEQQRLWSQKLSTNTEIENKVSGVFNVHSNWQTGWAGFVELEWCRYHPEIWSGDDF